MLSVAVPSVQADCIENGLDGFNVEGIYGDGSFGSIGQIFTACETGFVTSVTIHEGELSTGGTYNFWIALEAGGPNVDYTAGVPYEVFTGPVGGFPQTVTFTLNFPFPVTVGTEYRFVFNHPGIIHIRCTTNPNDYPGGAATDDDDIYRSFDLDFEVSIVVALPDAGRVPDGGDSPGVPLELTKAPGGDVTLSWGASCQADDDDYAVYEGTIGDFTSHIAVLCSTLGGTNATLTPGSGDTYYLVTPVDGVREGLLGTDSGMNDRPPSPFPCLLRQVGPCD